MYRTAREFYQSRPDLMIQRLSGKWKNTFFPDFSFTCTHERTCVYRRYTPDVYYIVFLVKERLHKLTMESVIIVQNFFLIINNDQYVRRSTDSLILACEQALVFGRPKRTAREHASEQRSHSCAYVSRYPPNGELARSLASCYTLSVLCRGSLLSRRRKG